MGGPVRWGRKGRVGLGQQGPTGLGPGGESCLQGLHGASRGGWKETGEEMPASLSGKASQHGRPRLPKAAQHGGLGKGQTQQTSLGL